MSNVYSLADYRAAKLSRRFCAACGDGPLIALEDLDQFVGACCVQHATVTSMCEGCGNGVLEDLDRPNKPRRA